MNLKPAKKKIKLENEEEDHEINNSSPYEKMIMKNRLEQMKFLESINLNEVKEGFIGAVSKLKPKPVKRVYKAPSKKSTSPLRRSRRLANLDVDLSEKALIDKAVEKALSEHHEKSLPEVFSVKESFEGESSDLIERFYSEIKPQFKEFKQNIECTKYDKSVFKDLKITVDGIAKVVPVRVTCVAVHPQPQSVLVCASSKYGDLGIWNVLSDSDPFLIKAHTQGITNLKFNPYSTNQLTTSSYDGILRIGDMENEVFKEAFNASEETCLTYFDFLSDSAFLVARRDGKISIVDVRSKGNIASHNCHENSIKTVNIHPTEKSYFVSCTSKGLISVWDLRKLQTKPLVEINRHKRCCQSAFFSPATGKYILSTSADDTLGIFDSSHVSDIKLKSSIKHNNFTGRWLTQFKATWLPNSDEYFTIGSMDFPRKIQIFDEKLQNVHNFMDDNLNSVTSVHAFHPYNSVLAGGNSSGKVFVFMN